MSIYQSILTELSRFGNKVTLTTEAGMFSIKGIIQPLLYKNKMYLSGKQLPEGYFDTGHYLFICSPEVKLPVLGTAFLEANGEKYILKRSETVTVNSEAVYTWAVVSPYKEPLEEDFDET